MPRCNLCGESVAEGLEARRHQRSHGPDTYYTDCFGDLNGPIVHPLTGQSMSFGEFNALRRRLSGLR